MRYECITDKIWTWFEKPRKDVKKNEIIWRRYDRTRNGIGGFWEGIESNWFSWFAWYPVKVEGKCVFCEVVWRQDRKWTEHSYAGLDDCSETDLRFYENSPEASNNE
jgi:hypothetical protein